MTIKAGVLGVTGYAGQQLLAILLAHPEVEIAFLSSSSYVGKRMDEVYPAFTHACETVLISTEEALERLAEADVLFTALPNGLVFDIAKACKAAGAKLVDFSADFRLRDTDVYESWYKTAHTAHEIQREAVYGLPELWRDEIKGASIIANPGCYTTASILALAPLLKEKGLIDPAQIIIDAKSGITGAGRKADVSLLYTEAGESIKAYGIANHRHTPEIEQELSKVAGEPIMLQFTPHLMPMKRGILATIYVSLQKDTTQEDLYEIYRAMYGEEPFVRIREGMLETRFVCHTNYVDLCVRVDPRTRRAIITSSIDNLMKGAASQAVQNMNILFGRDETEGILNGRIVAP